MQITAQVQHYDDAGDVGGVEVFTVSDSAKEAIRLTFNPSGNRDVLRLKILAGMFITECERVWESGGGSNGGATPSLSNNATIAIDKMIDASMRAVLAATTGRAGK